MNVVKRDDFLNKSDGKSIDPAASSKARTGVAPGNKGKPQSEDIKNKKRKPKPLVTCPHCSKTGGISVMTRWHFDQCGTDINTLANSKISQTNKLKNLRPIVTEIRNIRSSLSKTKIIELDKLLGLKSGWYQFTDEKLAIILTAHQRFTCHP